MCHRHSTYYGKKKKQQKTTFWKGNKDKGIQLEVLLSTERTEVQASTLKYFLMPKLPLPKSSDMLSVRELRKQGSFLENLFPRETQALPFIRQLFLPMVSKKNPVLPNEPDFFNTLLILVPFSWEMPLHLKKTKPKKNQKKNKQKESTNYIPMSLSRERI